MNRLESAIAKAARHYQRVDRAELTKQETPRLHDGTYLRKSPIDFRGWYRDGDRREPLYVECKEVGGSRIDFKDKGGIEPAQLEAFRDAVRRQIRCLLVVHVAREAVFVVDVRHVVEFAAHPWRSSLSLQWLQAFGEVAKVSDGAVWFLDTQPHPHREMAALAVAAEKARGAVVELYADDEKPMRRQVALRQDLASRPKPGTPEYADHILRLADEGTQRRMKARKWKPGRKWK